MNPSLLEIRHISKAFGGAQALADVSLEIGSGEIHALVGENGAGKSTLIRILSGVYAADAGEALIDSSRLRPGDVAASEAAGIAVIHQEAVAFPHLDACDNIFVGSEPRHCFGLLLDRRRMRREAEGILGDLGERFDPRRPVGQLPIAQRQMVAIARALLRRSRLLIMDEPTASLSAAETEVLFQIIRRFRAEGISILYVSHRLEEVFQLADRVTVLRDGRRIDTRPVAELTKRDLIRMMVGRDVADFGSGAAAADGQVLLDVRTLSRAGAFGNISFSVRAGEVVGMAGLVGAGRSEVARAIFGIDRPDRGTVTVDGLPLRPGSVASAIRSGVALVPEDRQNQGLVLPMSVSANLTLAVMRSLARCGFRSIRRERAVTEQWIHDLAIRSPGAAASADTLSGGNQQKLVLGKWLAARPRVLILDEPTRGVDVGAKAEIHRLIHELAAKGMATLLISSELPELLAVSDRILVLRSGAIAGELAREEATQEKVLSLALPSGSSDPSPASHAGGRACPS